MFGFSFGALMIVSNEERTLLVGIISVWLRQAGGDAGKMMLDAYYQVSSEKDPHVRGSMLDFLESIRASYVSS